MSSFRPKVSKEGHRNLLHQKFAIVHQTQSKTVSRGEQFSTGHFTIRAQIDRSRTREPSERNGLAIQFKHFPVLLHPVTAQTAGHKKSEEIMHKSQVDQNVHHSERDWPDRTSQTSLPNRTWMTQYGKNGKRRVAFGAICVPFDKSLFNVENTFAENEY